MRQNILFSSDEDDDGFGDPINSSSPPKPPSDNASFTTPARAKKEVI